VKGGPKTRVNLWISLDVCLGDIEFQGFFVTENSIKSICNEKIEFQIYGNEVVAFFPCKYSFNITSCAQGAHICHIDNNEVFKCCNTFNTSSSAII
jgi:hypothetical protein